MTWSVAAEKNFSSMEQAGFERMVENAIRRHGKNDLYNVGGEIRDECQKEWPASGQSWVVLVDTNGAFSIRCSPYKSIDLRNNGDRIYVYAARV